MQRDLVDEREWLERQDLLDGIALGQTMPGPPRRSVCCPPQPGSLPSSRSFSSSSRRAHSSSVTV